MRGGGSVSLTNSECSLADSQHILQSCQRSSTPNSTEPIISQSGRQSSRDRLRVLLNVRLQQSRLVLIVLVTRRWAKSAHGMVGDPTLSTSLNYRRTPGAPAPTFEK